MQGFLGQGRHLAFLAVLMIYGLALVLSLGALSEGAKAFPLLVLLGAGGLWIVKLVATLAPPRWREVIEPQGILPRVAPPADPDKSGRGGGRWRHSAWLLWTWLLGSLAAMFALGFLAGSALSILVSMRFIHRASWRATLLTAGTSVLFIHLVFAEALHVDLGPLVVTWLQAAP